MTHLLTPVSERRPAQQASYTLPGDAVTALVEGLPWPALIVDECGFVACANGALRSAHGIVSPLAGTRLEDRFAEYAAALRGSPWWLVSQEAQVARVVNGHVRHERLVVRPMPGGACVIVEDLTRLQELEAVDAQTARLASLGFMLAGACHEISNPLAAIYSMVQLLGSNPQAAAPDVQRGLAHIGQNVHRLLEVCQRLCGYSRATQEPPRPFPLDEALDESILLLRQSGQLDAIELVREADTKVVVLGHVGEMREVFQNLLLNAVQAMEGRGRLAVTTSAVEGKAHVTIHDSGPGIPDAVLPRLFEPFFTTKRNGKGTGLGLAISRELVQHHGGNIFVKKGAMGGACFIVDIPLQRKA